MIKIHTTYGTVHGSAVHGTHEQLEAWASRPGNEWPCSTLERANSVWADFDPNGDLIDILHPGVDDLDAMELGAWIDDVLTEAGLAPQSR